MVVASLCFALPISLLCVALGKGVTDAVSVAVRRPGALNRVESETRRGHRFGFDLISGRTSRRKYHKPTTAIHPLRYCSTVRWWPAERRAAERRRLPL